VPIRSVLINVVDVQTSVDFYRQHLGGQLVGEQGADGAVLDFLTGTVELRRIPSGTAASTWVPDDLQLGFRHLGFKVTDLDARVADLKAAGIPFHLDPIDAEGGVRLAFFFDPDGTLLEFVEGPLQYHEVFDRAAVDADWALGEPERPRLDHVAETVADLDHTVEEYSKLGWSLMSGIHQAGDARGFEIAYLRSGDTSLEVFTFSKAELRRREPQLDAAGFLGVDLAGSDADTEVIGRLDSGLGVAVDADGLQRVVRE
jgi:catechol 2,3-dioxygenase-like lactoylglutathione lyase family enzyme